MTGKKTIEKTIYYSDELNDEFSGVVKKTINIGADFKYLHKNIIWRFFEFIVYRLIMTPFAFLYCKIKFHLRVVNKSALKPYRKQGYFLYCNHTLMAGDAFIPNVETFPKRTYVVVNPDNISTPGTKNYVMMCGAIPIPQAVSAYRGFLNAIEKRILQGACVTVYPEAHIWPYYTGIRQFSSTSFRFPVKFEAPVFVSTTTFGTPKHGKTPRVTVYIDGPFYSRKEDMRSAPEELCKIVYETMKKRAAASTYQAIVYRKIGEAGE